MTGCNRPHLARGYCRAHYQRWQAGVPIDAAPIRRFVSYDPIERFWTSVEQADGCWGWNAQLHEWGYGIMRINSRLVLAHRFSYELHFGPIPDHLVVRHICHNPPCTNPAHLVLGTDKDNSEDMVTAGRSAAGERNGAAKLTDDDIRDIRADGRLQREIAADYGITQAHVSDIKRRKRWTHVQ